MPGTAILKPRGLVLAGGLARRMDGCDKALMRLDPETTLLDVLLERLAPQCCALSISANGDATRFASASLPVLSDLPGPSRGPLAGVLAGLDDLSSVVPEGWLLTVPGDTPFVPADLVDAPLRRDPGKRQAGGACHLQWPSALACRLVVRRLAGAAPPRPHRP